MLQILNISKEDLAEIDNYLNNEEELSETITYTAKFPNKMEMDIKVCPAPIEEGGAWTEAVLFNEYGGEVACTDVCDNICGDWELEYDNNTYTVRVVEGD